MTSATQSWRVWLPMPPSTNNLYANRKGGGRCTTSSYRRWKGEADSLVMISGPRRAFDAPVNVTVELTPGPRSRSSDGDNRLKAVLDCLVRLGVLIDDSREYVPEKTVRWTNRGRPGALVIVTTTQQPETRNPPAVRMLAGSTL